MPKGRLLLAIAVLVAACGGASQSTGPTEPAGESLSDFIPGAPSFDPSNQEEAQAFFRQQEQRAQELIRDCMAEQGFEYIPYVPNQDDIGFIAGSQEEYATQFGFGFATEMMTDQSEMEARFEEEAARDPNNAIFEAMTPEEQEEYQRALYGDEPDIDFENMTEEEIEATFNTFVPSGCENQAFEEAFDMGASQAFYEQFGPAMEEIFRSVQSDPRILALEEEWSACMKDKGYEFTNRQQAQLSILRQLEELGIVTDLEVGPDGELMSFGMEFVQPGDPRFPQVEAIAEEEIAVAVASSQCEEGFDEVYQEVQREYEQRFIDENREALERFRDEHP